VEVDGVDALRAKIDGIRRELRTPRRILERSAEALRSVIAHSYAEQRSPAGAPWPPKRNGLPFGGGFIPVTTVDPESKSIRIDVNHRAARWQFFGTSRVPARNPLPVTRDGNPDGSPVWEQIQSIAQEILSGDRR
jgi:hypothetical protein